MSGNLGSLVLSLSADMARFQADMGKANKIAQDTARTMSGHFDAMGRAIVKTTGLMVGFAGAASLGGLVKSVVDLQDEMSKMSQKVGVNIEELSGMAYAAGLADVSTEQLAKGMGKLNKAMYDAAGDPNGGPAKTFRAIGVSVVDAAGKLRKADDVMVDIAGKFAGMRDGAEKTALSMEVFGKAGADMIPLLNGGAKGLKDATEEARRFGLVIDEEAGKRAEEFNDNLTRLKDITQGAALAFANEMLPSLLSVSSAMVDNGAGGAVIFGAAIKETVRSIQEATVYWASFADKIGAWNDTGGLLGHTFSSKKAAEYKKRIQDITKAEMGQLAEIAAGYDRAPASGPSKAGTGGNANAEDLAAARAAKEKARQEEKLKLQREQATAQRAINSALREQNQLLEASVNDWDLAGLGAGLLDKPLTLAKPKMPTFSLTGAERMGFGGNPTSPLIDQAKAAREMDAITIAQINNQLALVDTAERFYQTSVGGAAAQRIDLLNRELAAQQSIYDSIQGDGADAVMARLQEQATINGINEKLLEQKKILQSTTAIGGMTVSLNEYARAASNVGAQLDNATTNVLNNMEDALVSFTTSGKASFASFADAVIKDLARIAVQQGLMGPLSEVAQFGLSSLGSMFGSGSSVPAQNGYNPTLSAAGGFDIPSGVNPVVQTHQKEMILPAEYAEVIRGMAKQPAAEPSQTTISVPVTVEGNNKLSSALRNAIEETVLQVMRRHA